MRLHLGILTTALALLAVPAVTAAAAGADSGGVVPVPSWKHVDINTSQSFRGLAAVDATTAWVGGSSGGVWRTVDAGKSWQKVGPELKKPLLFRDVEAVDADTAQILAIGQGRKSRIYRTTDGGATWDRTFTNKDQDAFYDCMAMFPDGVHGLAISDPVRGKFRIIRTEDGGLTWSVVPQGDAEGGRGRVRVRSQRHLPGDDAEGRTPTSGPAVAPAGSSTRRTSARRGSPAKSRIPAAEAGGCSRWRSRAQANGIAVRR